MLILLVLIALPMFQCKTPQDDFSEKNSLIVDTSRGEKEYADFAIITTGDAFSLTDKSYNLNADYRESVDWEKFLNEKGFQTFNAVNLDFERIGSAISTELAGLSRQSQLFFVLNSHGSKNGECFVGGKLYSFEKWIETWIKPLVESQIKLSLLTVITKQCFGGRFIDDFEKHIKGNGKLTKYFSSFFGLSLTGSDKVHISAVKKDMFDIYIQGLEGGTTDIIKHIEKMKPDSPASIADLVTALEQAVSDNRLLRKEYESLYGEGYTHKINYFIHPQKKPAEVPVFSVRTKQESIEGDEGLFQYKLYPRKVDFLKDLFNPGNRIEKLSNCVNQLFDPQSSYQPIVSKTMFRSINLIHLVSTRDIELSLGICGRVKHLKAQEKSKTYLHHFFVRIDNEEDFKRLHSCMEDLIRTWPDQDRKNVSLSYSSEVDVIFPVGYGKAVSESKCFDQTWRLEY